MSAGGVPAPEGAVPSPSLEGRALVGRIRFPGSPDVSSLYFLADRPAVGCVQQGARAMCIPLAPGERLSTGTYFNSYYESLYRRHAPLSRPVFRLQLEGDLDIQLIRRLPGGERRTLAKERIVGRAPGDLLWLEIPEPELGGEDGRVFLEILGEGAGGAFFGGELWADRALREVRLAVVVCTFRRETLAKELAEKLLTDPVLVGLGLEVFLVDNGRTLVWENQPKRLHLIPNRNLGGSGGFSCGLMEALEAERFTHVVLMDDDVGIDTEAVLRTATFFERASEDRCLTGCMLDGLKPYTLFEAGANFGEHPLDGSRHPLVVRPLGAGRDLREADELDSFAKEQEPDYGGFWFFSLPVALANQAGLLMPFFLNGDDIEYGLRLKRVLGARLTVLPPVGVWHPPFYAKDPQVSYYLWTRNLLSLAFLHGLNPCLPTVWKLVCSLFMELCKFRYNFMYMIVLGIEDALRGPSWLESVDHEEMLPIINAEIARRARNQSAVSVEDPRACLAVPATRSWWRDTVWIVSLGGHLIPSWWLSREPACLDTRLAGQWRKSFLHSRCLMVNPDTGTCKVYEMERGLGVGLFARGVWVLARTLLFWGRIGRAWSKSRPRLTGKDFWRSRCL